MRSYPAWERQSWRTQEKLSGHGSPPGAPGQPQPRVPTKVNSSVPAAFGRARRRAGQRWLPWWGCSAVVRGVCASV